MKEVLRRADGLTLFRGVRTTLLVKRMVIWSGEVLLEGWCVGMMVLISPFRPCILLLMVVAALVPVVATCWAERKIAPLCD